MVLFTLFFQKSEHTTHEENVGDAFVTRTRPHSTKYRFYGVVYAFFIKKVNSQRILTRLSFGITIQKITIKTMYTLKSVR